jgi:hypothetical protein
MGEIISAKIKHTKLLKINKCMIYLQVLTLSDIITGNGKHDSITNASQPMMLRIFQIPHGQTVILCKCSQRLWCYCCLNAFYKPFLPFTNHYPLHHSSVISLVCLLLLDQIYSVFQTGSSSCASDEDDEKNILNNKSRFYVSY